MSEPRREDFPPGMAGFRAWRRACGHEPSKHEGPWDPAKWGDMTQAQPRKARPIGPVVLDQGDLKAEIYTHTGPPPSDLRVRLRDTDVPGARALNLFFKGVHPMELQNVLPVIAERKDFLLAGVDEGDRLMPQGREALMLVQTQADNAWELTLSKHGDHEGFVAHGKREHLVALALLYADTVLGSVRGAARRAPWVKKIAAARKQLHDELQDHFVVERT